MYSCTHFKNFSLRFQSTLWLVPRRNEDRKQPRTMAHRQQQQDLWIWWCTASARRKLPHQVSDLESILWIKMEDKESARHQETGCSATQNWKPDVPSESTREGSPSHQETGAEGSNPNKEWRKSSRHKETRCMPTRVQKTWNTQTIDTCVRSSQKLEKKLGMSAINATFSMDAYKTIVLTWGLFQHRRWKPPYNLVTISWRIRKSTRTQNSRNFGVSSTVLSSWERNILKKFWTWNAWNIHHQHGRDQYRPMIKQSSGRRQKYVSALIPFFVSDRWKIFQEQQKDCKAKLNISRCIPRTKTRWGSTENRLNSSGTFSQDFRHYLFFARSRTTWSRRTSSRRLQGPDHLHVEEVKNYAVEFLPGHWTFLGPGSEEQWYGDSHDQKDIGIAPPTRWNTHSKETDHSVFKSTSAWSRRILKQREAMEILLIQNSCSKQFTLSIKSVSTEQLRIGAVNSAWQKKKKDESLFLWTINFWPCWGARRSGIVGISSDLGAWKQDARRRIELPNAGKEGTDSTTMWKSLLPTSCDCRELLQNPTECRRRCRKDSNSRSCLKTEALSAISEGTKFTL